MNAQLEYSDFIKTKQSSFIESGFKPDNLNKNLYDFQSYIVDIALQKGRFAIFADCGLGKTLMQLSWAEKVAEKTQNPVLILAPLAVCDQTIKEGSKFGVDIEKLKSDVFGSHIDITNYEQLKNIDC